MIVDEIMSKKPITIKESDSLKMAQDLMLSESIRHLPVLNDKKLLGIITESDIRGAFIGKEAKTNSGQVAVLNPAKMKVADFMTRDPMVVSPETHVEDAALTIYKHKIGALPVTKNNKLVGIISVMDILGVFVNLMGIIHSSSRIDVVMNKNPKNFEKVSNIIHGEDLNIISVGMAPHQGGSNKQVYFFRLDLCETQNVVKKIEKAGFKVVSAIN